MNSAHPSAQAHVVRDDSNGETVRLAVGGMHCAACVGRVESALMQVDGVTAANVNLALESARVEMNRPGLAPTLVAALKSAGYEAQVAPPAAALPAGMQAGAGREGLWLIFSILFTAPLVLQMVAMSAGADFRLPPLVELALAAPVQLLAGARFFRGAWNSLRHGAAGMDVLVALGTGAAFLYSLAVVVGITRGHLYFEASAVIITLVLLGKWLEAGARRGAGAALRQLMALRPDTARVERDGIERDVPASDVDAGDTVVVRPGERIAVDGVILEGETEVDESLITGESLPVARRPGEQVTGGAINLSALLRVRCTAPTNEGRLARIVALVEEAQMRKAPVQRLVDRVSAVFVPAVVAIAVVTFAAWWLSGAGSEQALVAAVAVLVIACPCALGLATPTALVAGTGAAARAGILIRDIQALERAAAVDSVVFDKTGTITLGRPRVVELVTTGNGDDTRVLALAASLQRGSDHPLARALVSHAELLGVALERASELRSHAGAGVDGVVDGHSIAVGTPALMQRLGIATAGAPTIAGGGGASWSLLAVDGQVRAAAAFADAIRAESAAAVDALRAQGIEVSLLTGDSEEAASAIAREAGIDEWSARAGPEDKEARIRALGATGRRVAMVGDGVNDAPALAAADVGIAMGEGTDVAMETAGITLMRPDPRLVAAALAIAQATLRTIRQNLFWAFVYNVVGIPIAALGLLNPAFAGAAMAMSSVCVVTNSLRLRRWRPDIAAAP